jgi:hypothetical protein
MSDKVAIIILTDTTEADGMGRVVNALMDAKEFKEAGDTNVIAGACGFCAGAFGVAAGIKELGHAMLEEFGSNMSYRRLLQDGCRVLTF